MQAEVEKVRQEKQQELDEAERLQEVIKVERDRIVSREACKWSDILSSFVKLNYHVTY